MRSCSVSAPVQCCNAADLTAPSLRFVAVQLLTKQVLYFIVEPKVRTKELLQRTCHHLATHGMLGTELFGLAIDLDGEYIFVDPEYKINKYAPKNWRASSTHGLDCAGKPLLTFHFRVHFYVENPFVLRDETSLHHYYLQIRQNLISRGSLFDLSFKEELLYLLVGLALQADLGDFSETQHTGTYFPLHEYFPPQMVSTDAEPRMVKSAANLHRANRSLSRTKAETQFIREASCNDFSPLSHNSHLYHLKHRKNESCPGSVWLTICHEGIEIYDRNKHLNCATGKFKWNDIGRLTFDRKKFEVRALNRRNDKLIYYCSSDDKSKHLLLLCQATHQFSLTLQPKLNQILRSTNAHDCPRWTADGCYSSSSNRVDQRISVISSTSSNTTSGIVSDKVHSHDESEDELEELEIMITHPPAPSVESLALAHLRDSSSPLSLDEDVIEEGMDCNTSKKSLPVGVTEGSQCSSSCSTVVQQTSTATTPSPLKEEQPTVTSIQHTTSHTTRRCGSATSSLELGYSHTAQNSVVSDNTSCLELDYSAQSAHTSSGVYTLHGSTVANTTVGVSTVAASTVAASSETSGICTGTTGTQESEGQRSRSGSIVSTSGSFHGDGSDPSDAGRGNLLSAEELSDLIVGRKPSLTTQESPTTPRRGVYPSRATVSSTLDSDSDYVTLPPPPIPPPRTDSVEKSAKDLESNADSLLMGSGRIIGSLSNLSFSSSSKKSTQDELLHRHNMAYNQHLLSSSRHAALSKSTSSLNSCTTTKSFLSSPCVIHPEHQYYTLSNYQLTHHPYVSYSSTIPEEANARFVTTKPHINIFTAHTGYIQPNVNHNYTSVNSYHRNNFPQSAAPVRSLITEARQAIRMDPSSRMKMAHTNLIPIVGNNNYLDVRSSAAAYMSQLHQKFPPPPPVQRQPPPPPPLKSTMSPLYSNSQIEQYKQQLYSDGDYVYYPMQDPAISKQEYMESKVALNYPPPPYPSFKQSRLLYRSTPNVAIASGYIPHSFSSQGSKYASNQNLNEVSTYTSGSSLSFLSNPYASSTQLYSPISYSSSSSQSLRYDPLKVPHQQKYLPVSSSFSRTRSDDNILNTVYEKETPPVPGSRARRPPPPPPYDLNAHIMMESKYLEESTAQQAPKVPPHIHLNKVSAQQSIPLPALPKQQSMHQNTSTSRQQSTQNHIIRQSTQQYITSTPRQQISQQSIPLPSPPKQQSTHQNYNNYVSPVSSTNITSKIPDVETLLQNGNKDGMLDIRSLREKSKNLDLPLISALCNDRSLIKQTNVLVLPKSEDKTSDMNTVLATTTPTTPSSNNNIMNDSPLTHTAKKRLFASFLSSASPKSSSCLTSSKLKYPVSGLTNNQIFKSSRKSSSKSHSNSNGSTDGNVDPVKKITS